MGIERLYRVWKDGTASLWSKRLGRAGQQALPLSHYNVVREATPEDLRKYGLTGYEHIPF